MKPHKKRLLQHTIKNHPDYKLIKAIITIARRHFNIGKNRNPELKNINPHFGLWRNKYIEIKFSDNEAYMIIGCKTYSHFDLLLSHEESSSLYDNLIYWIDRIGIRNSENFELVTLLISLREKIKHLAPWHHNGHTPNHRNSQTSIHHPRPSPFSAEKI